ncbi:Prohormone-3, partial [Stegodyphus mimosarum]
MSLLTALCFILFTFSVVRNQETLSSLNGNWPSAAEIQAEKKDGEMLEALMDREEDRCFGRKCEHSEECCKGAACVDIEGASGTCLPIFRKVSYQPCKEDSECGSGLICADSGTVGPLKTCQLEERSIKKKTLHDECTTSSDCDVSKGMCCQILRRHRMAPRKLCHYFIDPMSCIGTVATHMKPVYFIDKSYFRPRLG